MVKGVPSIPQGSLLQYKDVVPALADLGFTPAEADICLFVHSSLDMAATLHVDGKHEEAILGSRGLAKTRKLSPGAHRLPDRIHLTAPHSVHAGMQNCNATALPAIHG